jgi:hypothetical protein
MAEERSDPDWAYDFVVRLKYTDPNDAKYSHHIDSESISVVSQCKSDQIGSFQWPYFSQTLYITSALEYQFDNPGPTCGGVTYPGSYSYAMTLVSGTAFDTSTLGKHVSGNYYKVAVDYVE